MSRYLLRFVLFVALALAGVSHAQTTGGWQVQHNVGGGTTISPTLSDILQRTSNTTSPTGQPGAWYVESTDRAPVGGKSADMKVTRTVTTAAIARAAFRVVGGPGALAITAAAELAWCKYESGSWWCDERQDPQPTTTRCAYLPSSPKQSPTGTAWVGQNICAASAQGFADQVKSAVELPGRTVVSISAGVAPNGAYTAAWTYRNYGSSTVYGETLQTSTNATTSLCPAVVDFGNPAYSVPGGPADADGRCPSGRYGKPSENDWVPRFGPQVNAGNAPDIVRQSRPGFTPDLTPDPPTVSGPGSIPGDPTVTTVPDGQGGTTTTTTTPTYNITYQGNTYTFTSTTTTTTGGNTTTTTAPAPEIKTCGYPGGPACKIDESGTPTGAGVLDGVKVTVAAGVGAGMTDMISAAGSRASAGPWAFGYQLPTGACTPITATFPYINHTLTVDPCTSSVVELWRLMCAYLLATLTALYVFKSVNAAIQGS